MNDTEGTATAYLALGSNLGDRVGMMRSAVRSLARSAHISVDLMAGVASLYETGPVGGQSPQSPYLNSAIRVKTRFSPQELLSEILSIEMVLGRTRRERWEARLIDIDLLLFDDMVMPDEALTLPHPRLHERRFVLEPLVEIAGAVIHPTLQVSIETLATRLRAQNFGESVVRIAGSDWPTNTS